MIGQRFGSRVQQVRAFFETPKNYLGRREFDIRIREETVQDFTRGGTFADILDIGCGNGVISLPLLMRGQCQQLAMLDISDNMLALAKEMIKPDLRHKVEFINENFMTFDFGPKRFDLVLCIGVLAHVDSPEEILKKIAEVLKPSGSLILEITDSYHPVGRVIALYHSLLNFLRPSTYALNRLRIGDIIRTCLKYRLIPAACYRYSLPPPGSHRLFAQNTLYRMTRAVFGPSDHNRNEWLGNVFIYRLETHSVSDG
ncbi:MAG: class I SAM-dependent methyltransferase [Nitrososphaera sp.]|nr:class I SAM-dependent methyltransferase [Nitrososphaera sp.]